MPTCVGMTMWGRGGAQQTLRPHDPPPGIFPDRAPLPPPRGSGFPRPGRRRRAADATPRQTARADSGRHGRRRPLPARRPARPDRPETPPREPVRPRRQRRYAPRLPDDGLHPQNHARRLVRRFRRRPRPRPNHLRLHSARRRHHLHPRPDLPVADNHRHRHPWPIGAPLRCLGRRRHLGHRHHRRRRPRPPGRARQADRPHRLPAGPLQAAPTPRRPCDRRHRLRRHGCLRWAGPGPRAHVPSLRTGSGDRGGTGPGIRRRPCRRAGLADRAPDRRRRLRAAAGRAPSPGNRAASSRR